MPGNEEKLLKAIRDELHRTNNILSGISGFLGNLALWGLLAALLLSIGFLFAPAFFFTAAGIVAIVGIALALSALRVENEEVDRGGTKKVKSPRLSLKEQVLLVGVPILLLLGFVAFLVLMAVFD